jgi:hypothetical protein
MRIAGILIAAFALAAAVLTAGSTPAAAAGCGGYVNQFVWGCAIWDNNPKCPYHPDCQRQQPPPPVYRPQPAPYQPPPVARPGCAQARPGDSAHYQCQIQKQCDQQQCLAGCAPYRFSNVQYYNVCSGNCARAFYAAMQYCPR